MDELLARVSVRSGEKLEFRRVTSPDQPRRDELVRLYTHKGDPWVWQITQALDGQTPGLEAIFYTAMLEGRIIGGIAIEKTAWAGLLSHVFVVPEHRRKGIASLLIEKMLADFRGHGGRFLTLGTGFGSPAYHIYRSFGFVSMIEGSGQMVLSDLDDFDAVYDADRPVSVAPIAWRHWPLASALFTIKEGRFVRSVYHRAYGPTELEGPFLFSLRPALESKAQAAVLETEFPAVAGMATLHPDPRWSEQVRLLDLFLHPRFERQAGKLLAALDLAGGKVQCHIDATADTLAAALAEHGFRQEALLRAQLMSHGKPIDVLLMSR